MFRKVAILFLIIFSFNSFCGRRDIVEQGSFDLYLNGVKKGEEKYKIFVNKKKDMYELTSELRFQYPYPQSKRGYVDLKVYPYYYAVASTGEFLRYEYRSKVEDFSKTDLVETENSATELIDQDWRITTVFNQEAQRTDDILNDRIDLGVNAGYLYPAGKVLRFSQTRMSYSKAKDEALPENLILLEPYGFCLYNLLMDRIKGDGPKWSFNLAVPQLLRLKPCEIEYEGTLSTYVGGTTYILKHFIVKINDKLYTSFWSDKNNNVVMISVPTEGVTAIRSNYKILPFEKEEARVIKETIEIKSGNFKEEEIQIPSESGTILASIMIPKKEGVSPAVLIVQDYSPFDKDGNLEYDERKASPTKQLAVILAENGIITLRYPSKGLSETDEKKLSQLGLDIRKKEVESLIGYFKKRDEVDKNKIFTLSIGFGGISVLKAIDNLNISGAIFVSFPMKSIIRVWREQVSMMQNLEGQQEAYIELDNLALDVQKKDQEWAQFKGTKIYLPMVRELNSIDTVSLLRNLKCNSIFLYPEKDNAIYPYHGEILEKETNGKFKAAYLKGIGHLLTDVTEEGVQRAVVNRDALTPIVDFILKDEKK